jgi:hypothetical protein
MGMRDWPEGQYTAKRRVLCMALEGLCKKSGWIAGADRLPALKGHQGPPFRQNRFPEKGLQEQSIGGKSPAATKNILKLQTKTRLLLTMV